MSRLIPLETLKALEKDVDFQQLIKDFDIPLIRDGRVEKTLVNVRLPQNLTKMNWDRMPSLNELSPVSGLGAVNFCLREQLNGKLRVWIHQDGRSQHLWFRTKGKKSARRVRLYPNGQRVGEGASHCWFNATGFLKDGAAEHYCFMGLHSDYPFMWVVPRKTLEKQWYRIDSFGKGYVPAEDDIFRIPSREWDNEGGYIRLKLPLVSQYALTSIRQVGF